MEIGRIGARFPVKSPDDKRVQTLLFVLKTEISKVLLILWHNFYLGNSQVNKLDWFVS